MSIPSGVQSLPVPYVDFGGDSASTGVVASRFDTCHRNIYSVASRFFNRCRELLFKVYYRGTGLIVNHQDTLSKAVERGDTTTVKAILYYNSWWSGLSCFPHVTFEMFYKAAANRDADMFKILKEMDFLPSYKVDTSIEGALFIAAEQGDATATEMLLKYASIRDKAKEEALWKASKKGHYDVIEILTQNPSEALSGIFKEMLEINFSAGQFKCLRTLIEGAGRKIDGGTRYTLPCNIGRLLHLAAYEGDIQHVRYILKYLTTTQEDRIKASGSAVRMLKYLLTTQVTTQEDRNKALDSPLCRLPEVIDELLPASVPINDELLCNAINLNRTRHQIKYRIQYGYRAELPPYPLNFAFITIAFKKASKLLAFRVHAAKKLVDCSKFYNDKTLGNADHLKVIKKSWPRILDRILYGVQQRWEESKRNGLLYN
jgi:hypothetical protein